MWHRLAPLTPRFRDTRLAAHYASQPVAAAAHVLATPDPQDTHTALAWDEAAGALVGTALDAQGTRVSLHLARLELCVEAGGEIHDTIPLRDRTLAQGMAALDATLRAWLGDPRPLVRPGYDLPPHPIGDGARFVADEGDLVALGHWFGNATEVLEGLRAAREDASPVRLWPHHFDLATLLRLDPPEVDAEAARSVGVGLSPGDETYPDPYWYVSPWPYPASDPAVHPLPAGHWRTERFVAAILPAEELVAAEDQPAFLHAFLNAAIRGAEHLLELRGARVDTTLVPDPGG